MTLGTHETVTPDQTRSIGCMIGKALTGGEVLAITGDVGSGKTSLVQGIAQGLGIRPSDISSPTFALIHEHTGRMPFFHIDLYRLEKPGEVEAIGLEEYFSRDAVVAIEWANHASTVLPVTRVNITLAHAGGDKRRITITHSEQ